MVRVNQTSLTDSIEARCEGRGNLPSLSVVRRSLSDDRLQGQGERHRRPRSAVGAGRGGYGSCGSGRGDRITGCRSCAGVQRYRATQVGCVVGKRRVIRAVRNSVALDCRSERSGIGIGRAFSASVYGTQIGRKGDRGEDSQDQDDDEKLDERKALSGSARFKVVHFVSEMVAFVGGGPLRVACL
jgi:hypothetical protein